MSRFAVHSPTNITNVRKDRFLVSVSVNRRRGERVAFGGAAEEGGVGGVEGTEETRKEL